MDEEPSLVMLVNRSAGGADRDRIEVARSALASSRSVEVAETDEPGDVDEVVRALEGRTLVVCGGDGSLGVAVARLREARLLAEVTLGVVPLGTGNDLARALRIPDDPSAAAEVVLRGVAHPLDLLVDEAGETVINAAHAGIGVEAAQRSEPLKGLLGDLAYPAGAAAAGLTAGSRRLEVVCDGEELVSGEVLMVAVANGPTIGGGRAVCPDARPDDGRLDVMVCAATGPLGRAALGRALLEGGHADREGVVLRRGRELSVRGEPVRWVADGELTGPTTSCSWRLDPAAWRLLAPR